MLQSADIAAKSLSGNTLTSRKSTFSWGCSSQTAQYVVAKPTDSLKQPLNFERMTIYSGHRSWQAVDAEAFTFCRSWHGAEVPVERNRNGKGLGGVR